MATSGAAGGKTWFYYTVSRRSQTACCAELKALKTASGSFATTFNSTKAGPCGFLSPRSQCRNVPRLIPNVVANSVWVMPTFARTALISNGANSCTTAPLVCPWANSMASVKPCLILLNSSLIIYHRNFQSECGSILPIHCARPGSNSPGLHLSRKNRTIDSVKTDRHTQLSWNFTR
jgi:hypothetical protein